MAQKKHRDYSIVVENDGLFMHEPAGVHTTQKHRRIGIYAEMFATGMKNKWDHRVFIDLFAGPGHCRLKETGNVVLGSPLVALTIPDRFDLYILCEDHTEAMAALMKRVNAMKTGADVCYVRGDVNKPTIVDKIIRHLPSRREKSLYLCFVDPYNLAFEFATIRRLADARRVDFVVNLAFGMDGNRNLEQYYLREENDRIDKLLDDPDWRSKWRTSGQSVNEFLAERFSAAMESIGYPSVTFDRMCPVRSSGGSLLYYLAFYTQDRSDTAGRFWDATLKYSDPQISLF